VSSKDPKALALFLEKLGRRVVMLGPPQWNGKKWLLWFMPNEKGDDVKSLDLDEVIR
jgi:hypothetical protein